MRPKWALLAPLAISIILLIVYLGHKGKRPSYICMDVANQKLPSVDYKRFWQEVDEIVSSMTVDEKIGQMTLVDISSLVDKTAGKLNFELLKEYRAGGVYVGGNDIPDGNGGLVEKGESCGLSEEGLMHADLYTWKDYASKMNIATRVRLKDGSMVDIPPLIGIDTPHGNQHVLGAVLFPHNIGMAATYDPDLFCRAGYFTAAETLLSGFNWGFSPTVALSHNPRWGRFYESMGADPSRVEVYARAYVHGMQLFDPSSGYIRGIAATPKHYLGDGAVFNGIDEGNVIVEDSLDAMENFFRVNAAGFKGATSAGAASLMISYSAVNGVWMSVNESYMKRLFDGSYIKPHSGLVVSDQQAVNKIATQRLPTTSNILPYDEALARAVNAGIDMIMTFTLYTVYKDIPTFQAILKKDIEDGRIPMSRIDDAVRRILGVKYAMGLIRKVDGKWVSGKRVAIPQFGEVYPLDATSLNDAAAKTALEAAEKSLVLLKNENGLLPIDWKRLKYIVLVGEGIYDREVSKKSEDSVNQYNREKEVYQYFDDIGVQSGGWTVVWQGVAGNRPWEGEYKRSARASSLLDGIEKVLGGAKDVRILHTSYSDRRNMALVEEVRAGLLREIDGIADMNRDNTVVIAVAAEMPYAEFMGDVANPYCVDEGDFKNGCLYNLHFNWYLPDRQRDDLKVDISGFDKEVISKVREKDALIPVVSVLFSGRPLLIDGLLGESNAFIAAFLPGPTGGEAIANAIFGRYMFCGGREDGGVCRDGEPNRLPVPWIRDMESVADWPIYNRGAIGIPPMKHPPLFPAGFGLATHK